MAGDDQTLQGLIVIVQGFVPLCSLSTVPDLPLIITETSTTLAGTSMTLAVRSSLLGDGSC